MRHSSLISRSKAYETAEGLLLQWKLAVAPSQPAPWEWGPQWRPWCCGTDCATARDITKRAVAGCSYRWPLSLAIPDVLTTFWLWWTKALLMLSLNQIFCSMAFKPWGFESLTALCHGWDRPIGTVRHWLILFWKFLYFQIESCKTQDKTTALNTMVIQWYCSFFNFHINFVRSIPTFWTILTFNKHCNPWLSPFFPRFTN